MTRYQVILIDDELESTRLLRYFLEKYCPRLEIIGEAHDLQNGLRLINSLRPDIAFLDIRLHKDTIFDLLDQVVFSEMEIILVTAYEQYALKAFKYSVVDYILKPISIDELTQAADKAIERVEERRSFQKREEETHTNSLISRDSITIHSMDHDRILKLEDIVFCQSDGRYTIFFLKDNQQVIASKNLGEFEKALPSPNFYRVHHSFIINTRHIKEIRRKEGMYCHMSSDAIIPVSKRRQTDLNSLLKI